MELKEKAQKILNKQYFDYKIYKRKNGTKFIKILIYSNEHDGYIEVGRINMSKNEWVQNNFSMQDIFGDIKRVETSAKLLTRELKIKWTPKDEEKVWIVYPDFKIPVNVMFDMDSFQQALLFKRGLIFSTQQEAIQDMKNRGWLWVEGGCKIGYDE